MNFTREPIIETVITPKDGCKLIVRNTSGDRQEEYSVDAVEVVSFGKSFFFRSLERPKAFLLPVSDYEVIEVKETRVVLKKASFEKSIKIGGGKKSKANADSTPSPTEDLQQKTEKKKRRVRRKKTTETEDAPVSKTNEADETLVHSTENENVDESISTIPPDGTNEQDGEPSSTTKEEKLPKGRKAKGKREKKEKKIVSPPRAMLPPPSVLISDHIDRYKEYIKTEEGFSDSAETNADENANINASEHHDAEIIPFVGDEERVNDETLKEAAAQDSSASEPAEEPDLFLKEIEPKQEDKPPTLISIEDETDK